jgi:hypothetical protein
MNSILEIAIYYITLESYLLKRFMNIALSLKKIIQIQGLLVTPPLNQLNVYVLLTVKITTMLFPQMGWFIKER